MTKQITIISTLLMFMTIACSSPRQDNKNNLSSADIAKTKTDSAAKADLSEKNKLIEEFGLNYTDTIPVGDVDGNGKKDIAYIQPYNLDSQHVYITFSCDIPAIKNISGFSGLIVNVGDLDGNKTEELIYYPEWFQSNSAGIFIYGYKNNKWVLFGHGSIRRDIIADAKDPIAFLKNRIKKIDNKSFKLTEHIWREADIVDSTSIIKIE